MKKTEQSCPPQNTLFFKSLSPDSRASFDDQITAMPVTKGQRIFFQEDPVTAVYFIQEGGVKNLRETAAGEQVVIELLQPGDFFDLEPLFSERKHTKSAEAIKKGLLLKIPVEFILKEIKNNSAFSQFLATHLARKISALEKEIEHRALLSAAQRIGCIILRESLKSKDSSKIVFSFDKGTLSAHLSMKPETFSRGLEKLKEETGIIVKGSEILLPEPERLKNYVCGHCSGSFPCADLVNPSK